MTHFLKTSSVTLALLLAVTACGPKRVPGPGPAFKGEIQTVYALRYVDIVKGTGEVAEPGRRIKVHYTGWLKDGKKFDSSHDKADMPFEFSLGEGKVIQGWDYGVVGMKVGGKRRLLIPYQLAYGKRNVGMIPPSSDLTFDVELLEVSPPPSSSPLSR